MTGNCPVTPGLTETLAQLPGPQRRALQAALLRIDTDEPADERAVAFGLLSVLRAVARDSPVLIAVDDWPWLDTAPARVLRFLLRRIADEPVRVLVTARTGAANNQIAAALYISPKTVEANLARVYRKIGISSRAELGAWMAARRQGSM